MRLRRETGDFQIKVSSGVVGTIRKGLSAEDFVGELVSVDGVYEVISSASNGEGTVTAKSESYILTYNKETGAITAEQNSGGGSGGGSGMDIINLTTNELGNISDVQISNGLTIEDLIGTIVTVTSTGVTSYGTIVAGGEITDDGVDGRWYWLLGLNGEGLSLYYNPETGILTGSQPWRPDDEGEGGAS